MHLREWRNDMWQIGRAVPDKDSEGTWTERRGAPRRPVSAFPSLNRATFLDGSEAHLLNLSRGGALLQTKARMVKGATICLRLVAADAVFLLRGQVLRSRASYFDRSCLLYESAVVFDHELPMRYCGEPEHRLEAAAAEPPEAEVGTMRHRGQPTTPEQIPPPIFTVTAPVSPYGPDLRQIFGLNNW